MGDRAKQPKPPPIKVPEVRPVPTDDYRLVKADELFEMLRCPASAPVTNDHPAVIESMGSRPECAQNGCQLSIYKRRIEELEKLLDDTLDPPISSNARE